MGKDCEPKVTLHKRQTPSKSGPLLKKIPTPWLSRKPVFWFSPPQPHCRDTARRALRISGALSLPRHPKPLLPLNSANPAPRTASGIAPETLLRNQGKPQVPEASEIQIKTSGLPPPLPFPPPLPSYPPPHVSTLPPKTAPLGTRSAIAVGRILTLCAVWLASLLLRAPGTLWATAASQPEAPSPLSARAQRSSSVQRSSPSTGILVPAVHAKPMRLAKAAPAP
ncbi:MAG: hypothetical protein RLZZ244_878, partial [Verrucomicrobiota bacterium]